MARKSAVSATAVQESRATALEMEGSWDGPVAGPARRGGRWGGAGGRWLLWVGRAILWAFLLVVIVNGIRAPFERFTAKPSTGAPSAAPSATGFPSGAASAYALAFANVYLNYDQRNPAQRQQLSNFLPGGTDPKFGWDGGGTMVVQSLQVAGVQARDDNNGVVTLLAQANETWLQLAVPVYAKDGAMTISGKPALLPAPPRATPPAAAPANPDTAFSTSLQPLLQGFFQAYASGDVVQLAHYTVPGGGIPADGMHNAVAFVQLGDVIAPQGAADQRTVTATVTWQIGTGGPGSAPAKLDQTYQVSVVKKNNAWLVSDIQGATP